MSRLYKSIILFIFLFFGLALVFAEETVTVAGFGKIDVIRQGSKYSLSFGKLGSYSFRGSLRPLELETELQPEQLEKFPGSRVLTLLDMKSVNLLVTSDGLEIQGRANSQGQLKALSSFLRMENPYLDVYARIAPASISLRAEVSSDTPRSYSLHDKLGTELRMENITLAFDMGSELPDLENDENDQSTERKKKKPRRKVKNKFSPEISLYAASELKPSKMDPWLPMELEFSYNLFSQEIAAAGSMLARWSNPLGLDRQLEKDSLVLENTAVSIGWIPGAPSPTKIGFYVERAKFFDLDVGFAADISPGSGQLALMARCEELSMNRYIANLEKGLNINIPVSIPGDIAIKDFYFLFSPNGGQVGAFPIEKGLALRGNVELTRYYKGGIDFTYDMETNFSLVMFLDTSAVFRLIAEKVQKIDYLEPFSDEVLSQLSVDSVSLILKGGRNNLGGGMIFKGRIGRKSIEVSMDGYINPDQIVDKVVDKVKDWGKDKLKEYYDEVADYAKKVGKKSVAIVKDASKEVKKMAKKAKTAVNHSYHFYDKCYNECVPNYANPLGRHLLKESNQTINDYYKEMYHKMKKISAENSAQARRIRTRLLSASWNELKREIDDSWNELLDDRTVTLFFAKPSSAAKGRKKFQRLINEFYDKHKSFRNKYYNALLDAPFNIVRKLEYQGPDLKDAVFHIAVPGSPQYWDLSGSPAETNRDGAILQIWDLHNSSEGDRRLRFIPDPQEPDVYKIQFQNGGRVVDIKGGKNYAPAPIHAWKSHEGESQRWRIVPGSKEGHFIFSSVLPGKERVLSLEKGRRFMREKGVDIVLIDRVGSPAQEFQLVYADGQHKGKAFAGSVKHNQLIYKEPRFFTDNTDKAFYISGEGLSGMAYVGQIEHKRIYLAFNVQEYGGSAKYRAALRGVMLLFYDKNTGEYKFKGIKDHPFFPYRDNVPYKVILKGPQQKMTLERGTEKFSIYVMDKPKSEVIPILPEFFVHNQDRILKFESQGMFGRYEGMARVKSISGNKITLATEFNFHGREEKRETEIYYIDGVYTNNNPDYRSWGIASAGSDQLTMWGADDATTYYVTEEESDNSREKKTSGKNKPITGY